MTRPLCHNDVITADEIGIETAWHGRFHLKSAFQPVWLHRDGILYPQAVEGLIRPFVDGRAVPPQDLFDSAAPEDRFRLESLCRALHLRNHRNIGVPGIELFFNCNPSIHDNLDRSIGQLHFMAGRLVEIGLDVGLLVCEITEGSTIDQDGLVRLADEMRGLGLRIAIDDFGSGHSTLERVELIGPDIIKIDGSWFRRVVAAPGAARLLGSLIAGFHRDGAGVLVEGIETPEQLAVAIDAGADHLQGYLLGRPALVGTAFDETPIAVGDFLGRTGNVVALPARRLG